MAVTAVFGRRGSGKTTLIRGLIPEMKKPIMILDILGNFSGYESSGEDWSDHDNIEDALEALKKYCDENEGPGIITIQTGEVDRACDYFCSALWSIGGGTLVLDEVDAISIAESPCFDEAIRYGRNRGIDIVFGCRRPAEVSKNLTAAADLVYCFATREPRDIQYYSEFLGDDVAEQIRSLEINTGIVTDFNEMSHKKYSTDENGTVTILNSSNIKNSTTDKPDETIIEDGSKTEIKE